ncbi:hypothetical protein EDD63_11640 [Breznakia blatticola]|uniref:Uncharacterized protein n=1 Tax=Breznakia blatticola TaxID=1754012 RepID=A0A4R7ZT87_9FIRM|nr:hypothetical protein EDD63_11640 [Breznakia blatticola]
MINNFSFFKGKKALRVTAVRIYTACAVEGMLINEYIEL